MEWGSVCMPRLEYRGFLEYWRLYESQHPRGPCTDERVQRLPSISLMSTMEPPANPLAREKCRPLLSLEPFNRVVYPNPETGWMVGMSSTEVATALKVCVENKILTEKVGHEGLRRGQTPLENPRHHQQVFGKSCMPARVNSTVHYRYA
jgi:hypothetical protein